MQNPYISLFSKLTGFVVRRRVFLWSVVRRWSTQDRPTSRNTIFFFTQVVWVGTRHAVAAIASRGTDSLVELLWCEKVGKNPTGQMGNHESSQATEVFFTSTRARMGVFCYQLPRFFFYGTRVEATKHAIAQIGGWSIRSDCGMDMDMATRWSKHVTVASTKEEVVFQASIFQVLFSSSLVTQL